MSNGDSGEDLKSTYGAAFAYSLSDGAELILKDSSMFYKKAYKNIFGYVNIWDNDIKNILTLKFSESALFYTYGDYLYQWEVRDTTGGASTMYVDIFRYNIKSFSEKETVTVDSTAYKLKTTISTWYVALRTIALVGLLSVLVYVGIRIILSSSSAQDKAKYKNMLKDWLVAVCILFVLHYIMAFMFELVDKINDIVVSNVLEETTEDSSVYTTGNNNGNKIDKLMSKIRNDIKGDGDGEFDDMENALPVAGNTIMYLALVILTGVFTFQYLKRVVFMAFLTIIAPMIALTYPLDKIKDGKAQAFSYWLREYIFNCLIQPVHLLLYTVLICAAFEFAQENILYSIVALAFMVPAEKIIKEMFGMKSSSPSGTLGAAAGGAFVMSMINKMKAKPPKDEAGSGTSSSSGVRTASQAGGQAVEGAGKGIETGGKAIESTGKGVEAGGEAIKTAGAGVPIAGPVISGVGTGVQVAGKGIQVAGKGTQAVGKGVQTTGKGMQNASKSSQTAGRRITGANVLGSGSGKFFKGVKGVGRATVGAALGLAAGTVGLAAQVADGDLFDNTKQAFGDTLAAAGIGYAAGSNLTGQAINKAGSLKNWIDEKTLGTEEYSNRNFDRKFYQSDGYKMIAQDSTIQALCRSNKISVAEATQTFLNAGITDANKIRDALSNGISGEVYKDYDKAGISSGKDIVTLQSAGIVGDDIKKFSRAKSKYPGRSNEHLAHMVNIAKYAPKNLDDFKKDMVGKTFNGRVLSDSDAEAVFKELVDFF